MEVLNTLGHGLLEKPYSWPDRFWSDNRWNKNDRAHYRCWVRPGDQLPQNHGVAGGCYPKLQTRQTRMGENCLM